ncbi:MAG: DUF1460 domain-containing protein [Prevotella sp.]|nr:DUF1460 domain-containing protein [Prevotella sp.]
MSRTNSAPQRICVGSYLVSLLLAILPMAASAQVTYRQADSTTVCRLLASAPTDAGTLHFARKFIGRPYIAHTLEVNDREQLVVNTRQLDCTTLVETVAALTICARQGRRQWSDYVETLRTLRYRQGILDGYASRLHYFSDWIADNEALRLVGELQSPNPPFTALQTVDVSYMSTHPTAYKALKAQPSLVPVIREQEQALSGSTCRYIPKSAFRRNTAQLRRVIRDGDILAITCNKPGLDIAHLGFAVWRKDGLHLLNASQLHKKVVTEPMTLYQYLQRHPTFTGIRVVRINDK